MQFLNADVEHLTHILNHQNYTICISEQICVCTYMHVYLVLTGIVEAIHKIYSAVFILLLGKDTFYQHCLLLAY